MPSRSLPGAEESIVQQLVGRLPWGQNLLLMSKLKSREERVWYAQHADAPSLGLLLCRERHLFVAEYALRGMTQPIGIAEYRLQLPDDLARYLPSIEQIEAELTEDAPGQTLSEGQ
jgi:YhcG PDDEXK nuclease domain